MLVEWAWIIGIGILAGFLARRIMREGFGLGVDLLLGIVGSFVGSKIFELLDVSAGGLIAELLVSLVGALLILFVVRIVKNG